MDTEKYLQYLRFLSLKFSNAIVQSRLGGIVSTKCNSSGTDWVSKVLKNRHLKKIDFVFKTKVV